MERVETRGRASKVTEHDFMELYNDGLMDIEISEIMDVTPATVWRYRKKYGLPPNFKRHRNADRYEVLDIKKDDAVVFVGTVRECSEFTGAMQGTIYNYSKRQDRRVFHRYAFRKVVEE